MPDPSRGAKSEFVGKIGSLGEILYVMNSSVDTTSPKSPSLSMPLMSKIVQGGHVDLVPGSVAFIAQSQI